MMIPTRSFWLDEIPAEGIRVAGDRCLSFAVEGRGRFPKELMIEDDVAPISDDAGKLKTKPNQRFIGLIGRGCTPAKWLAAGWKVHLSGVSEWGMSREEFLVPRNFFGEPL